jgi:hypothetical protein
MPEIGDERNLPAGLASPSVIATETVSLFSLDTLARRRGMAPAASQIHPGDCCRTGERRAPTITKEEISIARDYLQAGERVDPARPKVVRLCLSRQ